MASRCDCRQISLNSCRDYRRLSFEINSFRLEMVVLCTRVPDNTCCMYGAAWLPRATTATKQPYIRDALYSRKFHQSFLDVLSHGLATTRKTCAAPQILREVTAAEQKRYRIFLVISVRRITPRHPRSACYNADCVNSQPVVQYRTVRPLLYHCQ